MRGPQTAGSWTTPAIIRGGSLSLEGALAAWASADRGAVVGMLVPAFELSKGLMGAAFSGGRGGGSLAVWLAVVAVVTGVGGCSGGGPHDGGDGEEDGGSATADAPPVPAGDGGRGGAGGAARDLLRRAACVCLKEGEEGAWVRGAAAAAAPTRGVVKPLLRAGERWRPTGGHLVGITHREGRHIQHLLYPAYRAPTPPDPLPLRPPPPPPPPSPSPWEGPRYDEGSLVPCRPILGPRELYVAADLAACDSLYLVLSCAVKALAVGGPEAGVVTCAGTDDDENIQPADGGGGDKFLAGRGGTGGGSGLSPDASPPR